MYGKNKQINNYITCDTDNIITEIHDGTVQIFLYSYPYPNQWNNLYFITTIATF